LTPLNENLIKYKILFIVIHTIRFDWCPFTTTVMRQWSASIISLSEYPDTYFNVEFHVLDIGCSSSSSWFTLKI
jgi:hypothetical protein